MSYETTEVPVWKSQGEITRLVMSKGGSGIGFMTAPPREGIEARVAIQGADYVVRIWALCREAPAKRRMGNRSWPEPTTAAWRAQFAEQERRRIWRVLYYYLKNAFECADSGVVELREILLPHIVMPDGATIADHILPRMAEAVSGAPGRLLPEARL